MTTMVLGKEELEEMKKLVKRRMATLKRRGLKRLGAGVDYMEAVSMELILKRINEVEKIETIGDRIAYNQAWVKKAYPEWVKEFGVEKARGMALHDASKDMMVGNMVYEELVDWLDEQEASAYSPPESEEQGDNRDVCNYCGVKAPSYSWNFSAANIDGKVVVACRDCVRKHWGETEHNVEAEEQFYEDASNLG